MVQDVTSNIPVPEVMKLIWWSVSDVGIKNKPFWSSSSGVSRACNARGSNASLGIFFMLYSANVGDHEWSKS